MGDYETKEERKLKEAKTDTEEALKDAGDKVQAGAKAVANKVADPDRDLENEYQKEKLKEKVD